MRSPRCVLTVGYLKKVLSIPAVYHKDFIKFVSDDKPSREALHYFKRAGLSSQEGSPAFPVSLVGEEFKKKLPTKKAKGEKEVENWNSHDFAKFFVNTVKSIHKKVIVVFPKQMAKIKKLIEALRDNNLLLAKMISYIKNYTSITWAHNSGQPPSIDVFYRAINEVEVSDRDHEETEVGEEW